jgi:signal transduction histidine kinase
VVAAFGFLAGRLARAQRSLTVQEQLTAEEQSRRLVLEERTRIARDLHDIVAHHMSLVVVQAETAPYRLPGLTDDARAELDSISASARSALAETRTLLSVLRQDDQQAEHAPQPSLELLDELVDGARRAGVPIETSVQGSFDGLRPGTSLAAYRVLQEALANAARHAPGAAVRLDVSREPDTLTLAVLNDGSGRSTDPAPVAGTVGHGITGMRERVTAEGGTLRFGPTETGGFAVRATLPLAAPPTVP